LSARPELDAEEILRRLTVRGVDFVVIGGVAAVLWGSPRMTYDLDICFATDDGNLEALGKVLIELGAQLKGVDEDLPFVPDPSTLRRIEVLTMKTSAGELDLLARPAGAPSYDVLRKRATRVDLGDFNILISSLDDLIAMKRAAGRTKDLADVEELEAIRQLGAE
jgi:predicted nucleotidyltransferase